VSGLGLVGELYRTARRHLIENLPGDAAWKCGYRPDRTGARTPTGAPAKPAAPMGVTEEENDHA